MVTYKTRLLRDNAHIYEELTYIKYCPIKYGKANLNVQNSLSAGLLKTRGQVTNSIVCLKVSNVYNSYHMRKIILIFFGSLLH